MTRTRFAGPAVLALAVLAAQLMWPYGTRPAAAGVATGTVAPALAPLADPAADDSVSVTGRGAVSGKPDLLTVDFAVETRASTVNEAVDRAGAAATRMRDALTGAGIAEADLRTSNLGISSTTNDAREITGYAVHQGLTAKIRNLPRAGAIISATVAAGGDAARLNGTSFTIEDDAALLREARRKAYADARAKAELYARAAGRSLGRVIKISETGGGFGGSAAQDSMAAAADGRFPIEPGQQQVTVTISAEWALGPVA